MKLLSNLLKYLPSCDHKMKGLAVLLYVQVCVFVCSASITIDWRAGKKETNEVIQVQVKVQDRVPLSGLTNNQQKQVNYTCYEPVEGLSEPIITIFTAIDWPSEEIEDFVRRNRLGYAKHQKIRYCELHGKCDFNRNMNWQRDPFLLALLPCTDYAVYMDGDALFFNKNYTFYPWITYMEKENLDLLMTEDYYPHIPMNSGVFITRKSEWTYNYFRSFYNMCACDSRRMGSWPFDQGVQYDLYMQYRNDHTHDAGKHAQLVPQDGLNEQWRHRRPLGDEHFVVHFAGCCLNEVTGKLQDTSFHYKYPKMVEIYKTAMPKSTDSDIDIDKDFTQTINQCLPMIWKELSFEKDIMTDTFKSSLVDFDFDNENNIKRVEVKGLACMKSDEHECSLKKYGED